MTTDDLTKAYMGSVTDNPALAQATAKSTKALSRLGLIGNNITTYRVDTKEGTLVKTGRIVIPVPSPSPATLVDSSGT